ncbi:hypothetical protein JCM4814A_00160 [Streptomyces phaeofaciens JCM 4814]|uniref:Uncharacterized protein n=1 Tax=Streptomyces phaeofaciens TaxID=68254 RepID=A0A918HSY4_9ACTN|nr:hypothetical protein [Streptomyces phaeofaciens]GGT97007.1 hypothetical protein GCM10010226_88190 [Streptomyces phaeofaciens]
MTTAPQPQRPADTSTTAAELATILDTVALIRFTEPHDARSGRATPPTHWLTGINRVSQIPTRDGTPQYEIANSGFSHHLPGDHPVDVWHTPTPALAPYTTPAPALPPYTTPAPALAPYAAPAPPIQQYPATPQQQYLQPAAPLPQTPVQPQPQYTPRPAAPQTSGQRTAAPWMTPHPQAPTTSQPAAPSHPAQGHHPQQPQQDGPAHGMR